MASAELTYINNQNRKDPDSRDPYSYRIVSAGEILAANHDGSMRQR